MLAIAASSTRLSITTDGGEYDVLSYWDFDGSRWLFHRGGFNYVHTNSSLGLFGLCDFNRQKSSWRARNWSSGIGPVLSVPRLALLRSHKKDVS
jgi:hypothetical protein